MCSLVKPVMLQDFHIILTCFGVSGTVMPGSGMHNYSGRVISNGDSSSDLDDDRLREVGS